MTDPLFRARLERTYAAHPLTADAVLGRILARRGTLDGLTELDLATAADGGATDQNHAGGIAATQALAAAVGLEPAWSVLDVGTGLGGTPRLLSSIFGCRCHGIELTARRFDDAVRLTALARLERHVTFTHGDFLDARFAEGPFDLVIVQGALMHFLDLEACLQQAANVLRPGGRLAVEDAFLVQSPSATDEASLHQLQHHWNGVFPVEDEWPHHLRRAGLRLDDGADLTPLAIADLDRLLADCSAGRLPGVTAEEHEGWLLGRRFLAEGVLRHARMLATRLT